MKQATHASDAGVKYVLIEHRITSTHIHQKIRNKALALIKAHKFVDVSLAHASSLANGGRWIHK